MLGAFCHLQFLAAVVVCFHPLTHHPPFLTCNLFSKHPTPTLHLSLLNSDLSTINPFSSIPLPQPIIFYPHTPPTCPQPHHSAMSTPRKARGWDASAHEALLLALLEEVKPTKVMLTSVSEKMKAAGWPYSYDAIKYSILIQAVLTYNSWLTRKLSTVSISRSCARLATPLLSKMGHRQALPRPPRPRNRQRLARGQHQRRGLKQCRNSKKCMTKMMSNSRSSRTKFMKMTTTLRQDPRRSKPRE